MPYIGLYFKTYYILTGTDRGTFDYPTGIIKHHDIKETSNDKGKLPLLRMPMRTEI